MNEANKEIRRGSRTRRAPTIYDGAPASEQVLRKDVSKREAERAQAHQAEKKVAATFPASPDHSALVMASHRGYGPFSLPFFPTIELDTGRRVAEVPHWHTKQASADAAAGRGFVGRLLGRVTFKVIATPPLVRDLLAAYEVKFERPKASAPVTLRTWDNEGEFMSGQGEHVPVYRLLEHVRRKSVGCISPPNAKELLTHIHALQSPDSSPWRRPLLRALSTHKLRPDGEGLDITYYVYTSRLLFELIADPSIHVMMKKLEPIAPVSRAAVLKDQPQQFVSRGPFRQSWPIPSATGALLGKTSDAHGTGGAERQAADKESQREHGAAKKAYKFSLAGILKAAESSGYRAVDPQPKELTVDLYYYQRSTCQWMLDHERDPHGLNGYFWEKWEWADGGKPLYYFPLAGEFRLEEPPRVTGGLLCEEMGLGKTVEVLSTVLSNPRDGGSWGTSKSRQLLKEGHESCRDSDGRLVSRATLIVVPVSLVGQWGQEVRKNARSGSLHTMTLEGDVEALVPISAIQVGGGEKLTVGRPVSCTAPYVASGETYKSENAWRVPAWVFLTSDDSEYLKRASRRMQSVGKGSDSGADKEGSVDDHSAGSGDEVGSPGERLVRVRYKQEDILVADNDIVLTTYELLRRKPRVFRKINFHRCVLDECQMVKTATTNIARMCQQVVANHRWMVSGTPLSSSISDLHGELNFLQVWPFSLQNDGFWERKIGAPFGRKSKESLELLRALLKVVMIRHSKSQTYLDGSPLVKIPARSVEWRGVDFVSRRSSLGDFGGHARFVYRHLEALGVQVCKSMEEGVGDGRVLNRRDYVKLKSILHLLQQSATHASLVPLAQLDWLQRSTLMQTPMDYDEPTEASQIRLLPPEVVLRKLAQMGASNIGGLNRDVKRHWAVGGEDEMKLRSCLEALGMAELKDRLQEAGLPLPRSWAVLRPRGSIATGSDRLVFSFAEGIPAALPSQMENGEDVSDDNDEHIDIEDDAGGEGAPFEGKGKGKASEMGKVGSKRRREPSLSPPRGDAMDVRKLLKVSDTIRIGYDEYNHEATVKSVDAGAATLTVKWAPGPVTGGRVYRFSLSSRRKPYVDLLIALHNSKKANDVHEAGFNTIYKAMAREPVTCPICMCDVVRPTVTICAHLFCRDCLLRQMAIGDGYGNQAARCSICRRPLKGREIMELDIRGDVEDAALLDGVNGDSSSEPTEVERINGVADSALSSDRPDGGGAPGPLVDSASSAVGGADAARRPRVENAAGVEPDIGGGGSGTRRETGSSAPQSFDSTGIFARDPSPLSAAGNPDPDLPQRRQTDPLSVTSSSPGTESRPTPSSVNNAAHASRYEALTESTPPLVVPEFRFTPTATEGQRSTAPVPDAIVPRDPAFPSVSSRFLSQHRAAAYVESSPKFEEMVRDMKDRTLEDPTSKFVIFSQYEKVVECGTRLFNAVGIRTAQIHGGCSPSARSSAVVSFTTDPGVKVILLTTGSAAAGLTLTAANTVYMLDPLWSAAEEAQALNRAHRIGQPRTVRCVVFYMRDTIEERLLALRYSKGNFSQFLESGSSGAEVPVGEGTSFVNVYALSELKKLFGMEGTTEGEPEPAAPHGSSSNGDRYFPYEEDGRSGVSSSSSGSEVGVDSPSEDLARSPSVSVVDVVGSRSASPVDLFLRRHGEIDERNSDRSRS